MPISIVDSFVAEKALDYAKLCELSKATWVWSEGQWENAGDAPHICRFVVP
mgnify:CR=1 FL=1